MNKPLPGIPFQPGKSGNISGRPKVPEELKDCTAIELKLKIWKLWKLRRSELKRFIEDPDTPAGELHIASVIAKGIKDGCPQRLDWVFNRLIGKVKEVVEIEGGMQLKLPSVQEAAAILAADYALLPAEPVKIEEL